MENILISNIYKKTLNRAVPQSGRPAILVGLVGEMKDALPAARVLVAGLIRPEMKVQIEVTAYRE